VKLGKLLYCLPTQQFMGFAIQLNGGEIVKRFQFNELVQTKLSMLAFGADISQRGALYCFA
jgi:hypothetical protein